MFYQSISNYQIYDEWIDLRSFTFIIMNKIIQEFETYWEIIKEKVKCKIYVDINHFKM